MTTPLLRLCVYYWPTWGNEMRSVEMQCRLWTGTSQQCGKTCGRGFVQEQGMGGGDMTGERSKIARFFPSDGLEKGSQELALCVQAAGTGSME